MIKSVEKNSIIKPICALKPAEQSIICSGVFSIGLMAFRILYTGRLLFAFLVWNLILALIPYGLSRWLIRKQGLHKTDFVLYAFLWMLFIPNSFYLITDLFHLHMNDTVPLWYDLALLLSFAWSGLTAGVQSIRQLESLFKQHYSPRYSTFFLLTVLFLSAFGIYIGRYLRFNSWDIITNPFQLMADIFFLLVHPVRNRFEWCMIICYTVLLTLIYRTLTAISVNEMINSKQRGKHQPDTLKATGTVNP